MKLVFATAIFLTFPALSLAACGSSSPDDPPATDASQADATPNEAASSRLFESKASTGLIATIPPDTPEYNPGPTPRTITMISFSTVASGVDGCSGQLKTKPSSKLLEIDLESAGGALKVRQYALNTGSSRAQDGQFDAYIRPLDAACLSGEPDYPASGVVTITEVTPTKITGKATIQFPLEKFDAEFSVPACTGGFAELKAQGTRSCQ